MTKINQIRQVLGAEDLKDETTGIKELENKLVSLKKDYRIEELEYQL